MSENPIRLGLVDSGLSQHQAKQVAQECRFIADDFGGMHQAPVSHDLLGHGSRIADIILHHAPQVALYNAQVFDARGVTTAATIAAALDWLGDQKVDVINMSLGLQMDREILRQACEAALARDIILIASSPAQGAAVYPAAYPGVIRATGDARCAVEETSFLDSDQADFGGCPRGVGMEADHPPRNGGASLGCGHISGIVAAFLQQGGEKKQVREWLVSRSKYLHSERRTE